MEYTQVAANTFDTLQMNAGIICRSFDPETGIVSGILGTTSGGVQVNSNPSFADFGEDMDNVPGQTKQLKRVTAYDPAISGTLISVDNVALFSLQAGSFDFSQDEDQAMRIQPLDGAVPSGRDLWLIGDYSAVNDTDETIGAQAGFCAVHLLHALNNAGFSGKRSMKGKASLLSSFMGTMILRILILCHMRFMSTEVFPQLLCSRKILVPLLVIQQSLRLKRLAALSINGSTAQTMGKHGQIVQTPAIILLPLVLPFRRHLTVIYIDVLCRIFSVALHPIPQNYKSKDRRNQNGIYTG